MTPTFVPYNSSDCQFSQAKVNALMSGVVEDVILSFVALLMLLAAIAITGLKLMHCLQQPNRNAKSNNQPKLPNELTATTWTKMS